MCHSGANKEDYGPGFYKISTHRAPVEGDPRQLELRRLIPSLQPGLGRTAGEQVLFQVAAVFSTIGVSAVGCTPTEFVLKLPSLASPTDDFCSDDELFFEVPPDYTVSTQEQPRTLLSDMKEPQAVWRLCKDRQCDVSNRYSSSSWRLRKL